jgi:hypothetical protein
MVIWVLSISRRDAGPGFTPRWGLLLAVLWVGGSSAVPHPHQAKHTQEAPMAL